MMLNEKIIVNKEIMDKIEVRLKAIKLQLSDKTLRNELDEVLSLLNIELKAKNNSLEESIKEKMDETKYSNPEIHFKFYMLYRKLVENQITEEEALKTYEIYIRD